MGSPNEIALVWSKLPKHVEIVPVEKKMEAFNFAASNKTLHLSNKAILASCEILFRENGSQAVFVQVGGNDGTLADPVSSFIIKQNATAVILEPVPPYFEMLKEKYKDFPRATLMNVAAGEAEGEAEIFTVAKEAVERQRQTTGHYWWQGIASFSKNHLTNHGVSPEDIRSSIVAIRKLDDCLRSSGADRLDFLIVDVEGQEKPVFDGLSLEQWLPTVVVYESLHLGPADKLSILTRLKNLNYRIFDMQPDTVAIHSGAKELSELEGELMRICREDH